MTVWQYAQLRVTYDNRLAAGDGRWTIAWHGPDATTHSTAGAYEAVVAELNRVGTEGWEVVDVAALEPGHSGHFPDQRDWLLTRYTFRRSHDRSVVESTEGIEQGATARSQPTETGQPAILNDDLAESRSGKSAALVRFTVYCLRDSERAGSTTQDRGVGSATGRLLIRREAACLPSQADIDTIESFRADYQTPGISKEHREKIKAAAAEYAASWMEGQLGTTWWVTQRSFPLSAAADLLDGSAEWLRGLVEQPLADTASAAGVPDPIVPIGAGATANFVTASVTAPLEDGARICEIVGIVIGLATGVHPLVIACVKRLAHGEVKDLLSRGLEQIIDSTGTDSERPVDTPLHHDADKPIPTRAEMRKEMEEAERAGTIYPSQTVDPQYGIGPEVTRPHPGLSPGEPNISRESFGR